MLEDELKSLAIKEGAIRAGIARREAFSNSPPSADMRYVKPWANTVVSFALTPGTWWIEDYLGKVTRMVQKANVFTYYRKTYFIGEIIKKRIEAAGYKAYNIIPNAIYRPDHTFHKEIPDHDIKPPLSLRYMAVGAGVGTFGWSGNVLVPGAWSNIYLGGVITEALLQPDDLLEESLCDNCRICVRVCPMGFIPPNEETSMVIGGRKHIHNKKRSDFRCIIGCGGYTGISKDGKWSTWSTGQTILPEDDMLLPDIFVKLRNDPANADVNRNLALESRGVLSRSLEAMKPTCATCSVVCSGPLKHRERLMNLLFSSGVVEKDEQGHEIVIKWDEQGRKVVIKPEG